IEADADGNYTVGGIVDETVPTPIATYTTEPTADPSTYASVKIVQVDADGNETMIDGEVGMLDITTDVGVLENGPHMLHALAVDEFGNVQTDESPQTTVHVLNFRVADVTRLTVTAVDGVDVPRTPTEPIPLRSSLTVGFDVDNGSLDAEELSGSVDGSEVPSESEENPENTFSLKVDVSALSDGMYTPNAVVTKRNGSVGLPLKSINLDNTGPMVEIQTPSEDHTVASLPTVHATYNDGDGSGTDSTGKEVLAWATTELPVGPTVGIARIHPEAGDVDVAVDQDAIETDNGTLVYTRTEKLGGGAYRLTVQVADVLGNIGEASREFAIEGTPADTTPPVITEVAPSGTIKGESWVTLSAVVNDAESKVISVKFGINDKPFRSIAPAQIAEGRIQTADSFTAGTHTVKLIAVSEGGTREHSWTFTLVVDNVAPTITSITPTGTIRAGLPVISASANDESGVDEIDIVLMDSDGKEVKGDTEDDGEGDVEGITRLDFIPEEPLDEGTYSIEVRATDTIGNSATAKGGFTIDFDTAAPVITMASPQNEARLTERRPQISISYADAESGVDVDSIRFVLDDKLINLKPNQKSGSQVVYTPDIDLAFGQHTVKLEVSDMAHKEGNVSEKSSGAREANMAVHEFTFFVESEEGPVLASRPINAPNPFKDNTRISFTLTRQSTVSIIIYDMTLRPVRVLVDNEVWDAGEYVGKGAIGWDGTTTAGEDLARGIYFCQIMVADGFEPEYAILKLALTR
ncbi:MAG: Ig-like domain-containing protein, partial [Candidatus Poribacteria bacterium]|nr:Ig-like domain-containing protein [Candidatus Poribacteria bacterium]